MLDSFWFLVHVSNDMYKGEVSFFFFFLQWFHWYLCVYTDMAACAVYHYTWAHNVFHSNDIYTRKLIILIIQRLLRGRMWIKLKQYSVLEFNYISDSSDCPKLHLSESISYLYIVLFITADFQVILKHSAKINTTKF